MLTVWLEADHAVVIAVGRHDETADDIYAALLDALELDVPDDERLKPPCCDDDGLPPADEEVAMAVSDALESRSRRTRRRR